MRRAHDPSCPHGKLPRSGRHLDAPTLDEIVQAETELADHLDFKGAGIDGIVREMAGKDRVIGGDEPRPGDRLLVEADARQAVDEKEGIPVRKDAHDPAPVPRQGCEAIG